MLASETNSVIQLHVHDLICLPSWIHKDTNAEQTA